MAKYIIGVIVLIVVVIGGFYLLKGGRAGVGTTSTTTVRQPSAVATSTYATTTFSVVYTVDYTVDPNFQNTEVNPKKPIAGVKFTIPMTMATGTNLASDTYLSVEQLPRAKKCTGDIYLADNVKPTTVSENGVTYSLATSSGAGAGNFYEEMVYAIAGSDPCTAVRYSIHSGNIGNYDPTMGIKEFDRTALLSSFDAIRRSLDLTSAHMAPSMGTTTAH